MPVSLYASTFYADFRRRQEQAIRFHESQAPLPERFLQMVWHHQRILRQQLRTLDGCRVQVLHPGFWNHEAGPDFRGAVLQIGEDVRSGDVEIDLRSEGWRQHGHDRNPNFKNVILHVIWEPDDAVKIPAPTLALKTFLDSPLPELNQWLAGDIAKGFPAESVGKCCAPLRDLSETHLAELLQQAAYVRLQRKGNEFHARARQTGWEQALREGLFRALGYKQNAWPMQRVAELLVESKEVTGINKSRAIFEALSPLQWQARLLGVSGLLPSQPTGTHNEEYLRQIWEIWWRERQTWSELILPSAVWRFSGLRPANHPQRRLALISHWLADAQFLSKLESWFTSDDKVPELSLSNLLQVADDSFWSSHWTFRSPRMSKAQPLIGSARITDLAINVILPWFWIRAVVGKNDGLQRHAERIYFNWPAAEDNAVLRLARQRLLCGKARGQFATAAAQQGLLQIVRDFCEHSNAICESCQFPELVREWNRQIAAPK